MKIDSLKDLEALVKMCNKHGVSNITIDGIIMKLDGPTEAGKLKTEQPQSENQYTDEQLLMWSAGAGEVNG